MPKNIDKIIEEFILESSKILKDRLKKVILFGSYARGDYEKNSDIDIMLLTDCNEEELIKYRGIIRDVACDIELDNDVIISPIVKNIDKYKERIDVIPFYMNVEKEGVILRG